MSDETYTVYDVLQAEYTLEPLRCLFCGSTCVVFNQYIGDAYCEECGRWQLENREEVHDGNQSISGK